MKIGVDATCWENKRGFGRFTREVLRQLLAHDKSNEYLFFIDAPNVAESLPPSARPIIVQTKSPAMTAASADGRRSLPDVLAMSRAVWRHRLDVFFFPAVYSYFPIFNRTKIVLTIHDLIAENHPELIFPNRKLRFFWQMKQTTAVRQADLILTVSEFSKKQIADYFNLPQERLRVVTEGADARFKPLPFDPATQTVLDRYGLKPGDKFLLYVGGISPHKNLGRLIDAFRIVRSHQSGLRLVLVGDYQNDSFFSAYPQLKEQVERLALEKDVIFTGFVPDEDLAHLYNSCEMLVFPSLEEGFGLPALEAMACGAAIAASDRGSLPEVVGPAGIFFDPLDPEDIAAKIQNVLALDMLRRALQKASLQRAEDFGWEKSAARLREVFDQITKKQKSKSTKVGSLIDSRR